MRIKLIMYCSVVAAHIGLFSLTCSLNAHAEDVRVTPVVKAVEKVKPCVVNISTSEQVLERANPFSRYGRDPFFDRFFNDFFDNRYERPSVRTHLGSGVIFDSRGFVLTNWHVVEKASAITVTTHDEQEYSATLIGADPKSDLAVLKISSEREFPQVALGNSDSLLIGETVIAIGNPFGLSHTVTTGVVSAVHRSIKANEMVYENFIQTDASINPGNSGGPLLNILGELIGINTAIYGQGEGIGFAIPVNTAGRIVGDLLAYGEVRPAWLGFSVSDLDEKVSAYLGLMESHGVIVSEVVPGSPAEKAGVQGADVILTMGDQKVKSKAAYKRILSQYTADDIIRMDIFRQGQQKQLSVKASAIPDSYVDTLIWEAFGFKIISNGRSIAGRYGLYSAAGLVISELRRGGQAQQKGLEPGDIILKVQGISVNDVSGFNAQTIKNIHRDSMVLLVQRGRYGYYVTMDF